MIKMKINENINKVVVILLWKLVKMANIMHYLQVLIFFLFY